MTSLLCRALLLLSLAEVGQSQNFGESFEVGNEEGSRKKPLVDLLAASWRKNLDAMKILKKMKPMDLNNSQKTEDGFNGTLLHLASSIGTRSAEGGVDFLLEHQAKVDARDGDGWTPLHLAVRYGHLKIAERLLKHGASVHAQDAEGRSPLHLAAEFGGPEGVQLLLDVGADTSAQDAKGRTSLYIAAKYGKFEVVRTLLGNNGDMEVPDDKGLTPLEAAASEGHVKIMELLHNRGASLSLKAATINATTKEVWKQILNDFKTVNVKPAFVEHDF